MTVMLKGGEASAESTFRCAKHDNGEDCEDRKNCELSNVLLHLSLRSRSKHG